ncbi:MAG: RbsD/FucU family protein [Chloroflexota bacterium]|nr:RbsD/FucU family protein [Chloroflexota bacterium]
MLTTKLLHPEILEALAGSGHGGGVLIADGNYPFSTRAFPAAKRVYLNFTPGKLNVIDVLDVIKGAIPVEAAHVMATNTGDEAPIVAEFRALLPDVPFEKHDRFAFYDLARGNDTCLVIATGEQRVYANIYLVIGVVKA